MAGSFIFIFFPAAQANWNQDLYKILQIERWWGWVIYISVRAHANIYINQILFFLFLGSGRVLLHDTIAIDRPSFVSAVTTQI